MKWPKAVGVDSAALKELIRGRRRSTRCCSTTSVMSLDLKATPAIFVEGRHVDSLVVMDSVSRVGIADWYFSARAVPRPR